MTTEDLARETFIAHHAQKRVLPADFDAAMAWWDRGWTEPVQMGPETWRLTPRGLAVLASAAAAEAAPRGPVEMGAAAAWPGGFNPLRAAATAELDGHAPLHD